MRQRMEFLRLAVVCSLFLSAFLFALSGCEDRSQPVKPEDTAKQGAAQTQYVGLSKADARIQAAIRVQEKHTQRLMASSDIVGTAVGLNDAGEVVVKIYTVREGVPGLPASLDGEKVDVEVTGVIHAMDKPTGKPTPIPKVSHQAKQTPPIQLGTSGGWSFDRANGYCCGGTLGSLVLKGGKKYILSNYHVFESDIVRGGNNQVATNGDPVIQPGLIDVSCTASTAQAVGTLLLTRSLPSSNVDVSIAEIMTGQVRTDGAILEIGTISSSTVGPSIGQLVKKSGRTTGLSRSKISGLNGTVSVSYENECAGGPAFTKTFTGQILISNKGSNFLAGGDSGSLMVEDIATKPRAVGLLFAGSSTIAVANPIDEVLGFLGATMVGN